MKVITIIGTRPEMIRLSVIIKKLDKLVDRHVLVHTGQNSTSDLMDIFFQQLNIRKPDYYLRGTQTTLGQQIGTTFKELEEIIQKEKPDKALLLGDTNSALSTILIERLNVPVYHMEAGNRCYDLRVPEEKNRRVIDSIATYNLPYTLNSEQNLLRDGIPSDRIFVSGNPIYEVIQNYNEDIEKSDVLSTFNLKPGEYMLATFHRAECVDDSTSLLEIINGLNKVAETYNMPILCSIHPRTKEKIKNLNNPYFHPLIQLHKPFGFFDFVKLEKNALCVLSDSGTVQEECCILQVPAVTMRKTTERPETIECGSNILCGICSSKILNAVNVMIGESKGWNCPEGYLDDNVSERVVKFIIGGFKNE